MDASQQPRLLMAPEIVCDSGAQLALAAVAWLFLLGWGFGAPLGVYIWYMSHNNTLGDFGLRIRAGLLFSEYERSYAFWETSLFLQRFAAVVASVFSPSAPQVLRVVLVLAVGNSAAFMHNSNLPFDNQSAELLDVLSTQALQVFCALGVALLLGFSNIVEPHVSAALVFVVLLVHVILVLRIVKHFFLNLRRSYADAVVALHMKGKSAGWLQRRIFRWEMHAQARQAHVTYNEMSVAIVVKPPPENPGKAVQDHEQRFVASGLADCIAHTIADCKVDRLSVHLLEYLGRQTFALSVERLDREAQVRMDTQPSQRVSLSVMESPSGPRGSMRLSPKTSFMNSTFRYGMLAEDFQGALNAVCLGCQPECMEQAIHDFMIEKGVPYGNYHLSPLERMLRNFANDKLIPPWMRQRSMAPVATKPVAHRQKLRIVDVDSDDEPLSIADADGNQARQALPPVVGAASLPFHGTTTSSWRSSEGQARVRPPPLAGEGEPEQCAVLSLTALPNAVPDESANVLPNAVPDESADAVEDAPAATEDAPAAAEEASATAAGDAPVVTEEALAAVAGDAPTAAAAEDVPGPAASEDHGPKPPPLAVLPESVLPSSGDPWIAGVVVVDPLLAEDAAGGPRQRAASGVDGGLYAQLGTKDHSAFPAEVSEIFARDLEAKLQVYGERKVIHVVQPNLCDQQYESDEVAIEALSVSYRHLFQEALVQGSDMRRLRLSPLAFGELAGDHEDHLPELTAQAVASALQSLGFGMKERLLSGGSSIELCVVDEVQAEKYQAALSGVAALAAFVLQS